MVPFPCYHQEGIYVYIQLNFISVIELLVLFYSCYLQFTFIHDFRMKKSYSKGDRWENGTILTIQKVNAREHQGNYTCAPSTLTSSSVIVHIIDEGKMPQDAAVYDAFDSSSSSSSSSRKIDESANYCIFCLHLIYSNILFVNYFKLWGPKSRKIVE